MGLLLLNKHSVKHIQCREIWLGSTYKPSAARYC